jgi:predicted membrane channel-forming protein YqfA (hemolysin III family)
MNLKTRKRLSLLILVVGMPLYVVVAVTLVNWMDVRFGRQPILVEVGVYVLLGFLWILPFKRVFSGIGRGE